MKENNLLQSDASHLIASALSAIVNVEQVDVGPCRGTIPRVKTAAARCLGRHGCVLRARFTGFGLGFEAAPISINMLVDLSASPEQLVSSALNQASTTVTQQARMRARAIAIGIQRPLDREAFGVLDRLFMDDAAATALRNAIGSDEGVAHWLMEQLSLAPTRPASMAVIHVVGVDVKVPFTLMPLALSCKRLSDTQAGPRWMGAEVRIEVPPDTSTENVLRKASQVIDTTPLAGRDIVSLVRWPHPDVTNAIARWNAGACEDRKISISTPNTFDQQWSVTVEQRPVRIVDAFC